MERKNENSGKEKQPSLGESSGVRKMEKEIERTNNRSDFPDDLTKKIVKRLPLKSAVRLCTVSANWLGMISQYNYAQADNPDTLFFTFTRTIQDATDPNYRYRRFYWSTQTKVLNDNHSDAFKSCQIENPSVYYVCPPIRGLVLCYYPDLLVCNPALGTFLSLPSFPSIMGDDVFCFFGFDPTDECFKVLAVQREVGNVAGHIQILTLGEGELFWRPIHCNHPHSLLTALSGEDTHPINGVFIEDKIHYGAILKSPKQGQEAGVLMMLDLHAENLSLIPLPEEVQPHLPKYQLIKFRGKLAVVPYPISYGKFDLWVLADYNTPTWLKQSFDIPGWENAFEHYHLKGTCSDSELIFAQNCVSNGAVELLYYDMEDLDLQRISIKGVESEENEYDLDDTVETFLDYVEEPLLLPGGSKHFLRNMIGRRCR